MNAWPSAPLDQAQVIEMVRELGRGANTSRPLSREQSRALFAAILADEVDDLHLGALLIAYRIKGEEAVELAGMLDAAQATLTPLPVPVDAPPPVVIASYNGTRRLPNLVPLLALTLASRGLPVLVHGDAADAYGRISSASVFAALGVDECATLEQAAAVLREGRDAAATWSGTRLAFVPTEVLSVPLARMLALRERIGLRNSAHTVVKLLDPFAGPSLRLVNYTHPPYRDATAALFTSHAAPEAPGVLLARGCEGEAAADPRRQVAVEWLAHGGCETVLAAVHSGDGPAPVALPATDATATARWTRDVLAGRAVMPPSLQRQVDAIVALCTTHPTPAAKSGVAHHPLPNPTPECPR
jgi:anthranilate phosphoribosyltransferase